MRVDGPVILLQVGAASDHDLVLLKGQLEAARAEGLSAQRQWAAEQQQLKRTAQELWAELQRCHEALTQTVGQVCVLQAAACSCWLQVPPECLILAAETGC